MKKSNLLKSYSLLASMAACLGMCMAAPYEPEGREIVWGQGPPASPTMQLRLRVFGDEFYGRTQTLAGYTVIYVYEDNSYYYAKLSDNGSSLVSTGVLAHLLPPAGLSPRLDIGVPAIIQQAASQRARYDSLRKARWDTRVSATQIFRASKAGSSFQSSVLAAATENSKPVTGNVVGLTILARFSDTVESPAFSQARFSSFFNNGSLGAPGIPAVPLPAAPNFLTPDGNVGSVHNYFSEQSGGKLNLVHLVTTVVALPGTRASYNFVVDSANNEVEPNARAVAEKIIIQAVSILVGQGFNFAPLTVDSSGAIRVTNLILQSPDSGAYMQGIWPHAGSIADPIAAPIIFGSQTRPRIIREYSMRTVGVTPVTVGPTCHDAAQMLTGFPDLYAYPNMGVGNYCLMGSGSDGSAGSGRVPPNPPFPALPPNTTNNIVNLTLPQTFEVPAIPVSSANGGRRPAPINPHFKDLVGWNTVTEIVNGASVTATLPSPTAVSSVARRFRKVGSVTESFIVENRAVSKWIAAPQDTGVAIWHVNDAKNGNIFSVNGEALGVSLEQADGLSHLESPIAGTVSNPGDIGDLFKAAIKPTFSEITVPNSSWQDGTRSSFQARVLSTNGVISSDVAFGPYIADNTIIVDSPNGGEYAFSGNVLPITWTAKITGNVRIDLFKGGVLDSQIANNVVTSTRKFNWTVPKTIKVGSDYRIRITSMTNPPVAVPVRDDSDNLFTISDSAFPKGEIVPHGWVRPANSSSTWAVTNRDALDGSFSLASIKPRDGANSSISYTSNFVGGDISFFLKVSTEANYDFARFYIDGIEQTLDGALGISGQTDWQQYVFPVMAGDHTLEWVYQKDDSFGGLNDSVFLDAVTLPETTQEITVRDFQYMDLQSGVGTTAMADVKIGSVSATRIFDIRNTGSADLSGISITKAGANPADFIVSVLPRAFIVPGGIMSFTVTFKPTDVGQRNASLIISSNDVDEREFSIGLSGLAVGLPSIVVRESTSPTALVDGRSSITFASSPIGSMGSPRTFTITNTGAGPLNLQAVTKTGSSAAEFIIGALSSTTVAPAGNASFTITFKPSALRTRSAAIRILNDDLVRGPFDFKVSGIGLAATLPTSSFSSGAFSINAPTLTWQSTGFSPPTTLEIGGLVYNSISVQNGSGVVEVSSNLVDWFSGIDYTTVVSDSGSTTTVRDKTPSTVSAKRYIRVR